MEPLDQQALQPEHTCTLASACKPFALTPKIGSILHPKHLFKFLLCSLLISNSLYATKKSYRYTGTHNNYPINVTYIFEEKNNQSHITAIIDTEKIKETNTTILKNNTLHQMTQTTHNDIDGEYFDWMIQKKEDTYQVTFKNTRYHDPFNATLNKNREPMSLQGLIYTLRHQHIRVGDAIKANLIMPWKTILPIRFIVKEKTPLSLHNKMISTYKIQLEIDLIFGKFLPKSTLWVTEKKPHILLKQSGLNKKYEISAIR